MKYEDMQICPSLSDMTMWGCDDILTRLAKLLEKYQTFGIPPSLDVLNPLLGSVWILLFKHLNTYALVAVVEILDHPGWPDLRSGCIKFDFREAVRGEGEMKNLHV